MVTSKEQSHLGVRAVFPSVVPKRRDTREQKQSLAFPRINETLVDPNGKCKTRTRLHDSQGGSLEELGLGNDFLRTASHTPSMEEKKPGELVLIKNFKFYSAPHTVP